MTFSVGHQAARVRHLDGPGAAGRACRRTRWTSGWPGRTRAADQPHGQRRGRARGRSTRSAAQGFAVTDQELEEGLRSAAAPVREPPARSSPRSTCPCTPAARACSRCAPTSSRGPRRRPWRSRPNCARAACACPPCAELDKARAVPDTAFAWRMTARMTNTRALGPLSRRARPQERQGSDDGYGGNCSGAAAADRRELARGAARGGTLREGQPVHGRDRGPSPRPRAARTPAPPSRPPPRPSRSGRTTAPAQRARDPAARPPTC